MKEGDGFDGVEGLSVGWILVGDKEVVKKEEELGRIIKHVMHTETQKSYLSEALDKAIRLKYIFRFVGSLQIVSETSRRRQN
ncbi:unnamed protein product [Dovyalis caffra]|uniref:Uncharacterized protein n=1 Tax=Dovyalis caffra TaxID=77055 RepID=A0AAV1QRH8_9ROSI|nr:unnamed protein product [Dovyalis caffra]